MRVTPDLPDCRFGGIAMRRPPARRGKGEGTVQGDKWFVRAAGAHFHSPDYEVCRNGVQTENDGKTGAPRYLCTQERCAGSMAAGAIFPHPLFFCVLTRGVFRFWRKWR